jgi:anti-anti-sigma regulatory factor
VEVTIAAVTTAGVAAVGVLEALVFDAEAVTQVDATGLAALEDLVDALSKDGIELLVARAKTPLTARLAEFGLSGILLHPTVHAAVEAAI